MMRVINREQLDRFREESRKKIQERALEKTNIIVGMGTCGIAAGANDVMKAIIKEVNKRNLQVSITQTGCIGMCEQEPLVDVQRPGEDRVTYKKVTPADVPRIIVGHVMHGNIVEDLAIARFEEI
jgi:NADP-reducing hydrogenase subunit HndB